MNVTKWQNRLLEVVAWTQIRNLHKMRVFQQMYGWMFLVPVLARIVSKFPETVIFKFLDQELTFSITLPFSWEMFYYSSVSIVISNVIYQLFCPRLIKDHANPTSFIEERKGIPNLERYRVMLGEPPVLMEKALGENEETKLDRIFWSLHSYADSTGQLARVCTALFLAIGFVLIGIVVIEGFQAVLS
jgi:hypothetical protein